MDPQFTNTARLASLINSPGPLKPSEVLRGLAECCTSAHENGLGLDALSCAAIGRVLKTAAAAVAVAEAELVAITALIHAPHGYGGIGTDGGTA